MNSSRLPANILLRRCRNTQLVRQHRKFISTNLSSADTRLPTTSQPAILPTSTPVPIRASVTGSQDHVTSQKNQSDDGNHPESPLERYQAMVAEGTLRKDDHQTRIIEKLQHLYENVLSYTAPPIPPQPLKSDSFVRRVMKQVYPGLTEAQFSRLFSTSTPSSTLPAPPEGMPTGLYLYGDVGTGKTMLMDLFYHSLPSRIPARRAHFHAFMIDVHKRIHEAKIGLGLAGGDPIAPVARDLAREAQILCFDEFQVTDVADAMILRRLMESLLSYGVVVVVTSNRHPDDLYKNGIQRESFVPCIELMKEKLDVTNLDSGTDYRRLPRALAHVYRSPLNNETRAETRKIFEALAGPSIEHRELSVWGRTLKIPECGNGVAWFDFQDLCGSKKPLSAADYIEIASTFPTLFVTEVPKMDLGSKDMARRFITFVDACYESKTKLFISSEVSIFQIFSDDAAGQKEISAHMRSVMDDLGLPAGVVGASSMFTGDEEIFAFARCCSRLVEMGSKQWAESTREHTT